MPGMAGRKSLPTHLKIIKGTHQPCRDNKDAPVAITRKPVAPSWLNKRAKQIFSHMVKRLEEIKLASATYTEVLALLCSRLEEVERFDKVLNEHSYVFVTNDSFGNQVIKTQPEVALRKEAMRHAHALLAEFGLTPSASSKVSVGGKKKEKTEWE